MVYQLVNLILFVVISALMLLPYVLHPKSREFLAEDPFHYSHDGLEFALPLVYGIGITVYGLVAMMYGIIGNDLDNMTRAKWVTDNDNMTVAEFYSREFTLMLSMHGNVLIIVIYATIFAGLLLGYKHIIKPLLDSES